MDRRAAAAADSIRARAEEKSVCLAPKIGIILGSGLSSAASDLKSRLTVSTRHIPGFPRSSVEGHSGALLVGTLHRQSVAILSGRVHGYEGYPPDLLGFGVRVIHALGCRTLIVTNAAGALNPSFAPGDVMVIEDHISFPSLAGHSPLAGRAEPGWPRFVDLTDAYSPGLRNRAHAAAAASGVHLQSGVYVMVGGPNFETPAEVRFLRQIGGDAVGMSTTPEVIVARQLGMEVLGLSAISNLAAGLPGALLEHKDVLAMMERSAPTVAQVIRGVVEGIDA